MRPVEDIQKDLVAARSRRLRLSLTWYHYKEMYSRECAAINTLRVELRDHPRQLYWSQITHKPWPIEIIRLITEYFGIAEKLYTGGRMSDWRMINPRTLMVLHIKHPLRSVSVRRFEFEIRRWLRLNAITVSSEKPRWKRYIQKDSMKEMAVIFPAVHFTVGNMVMTLLGENGVIEFHVGPQSVDHVHRAIGIGRSMAGLKFSQLERTRTGFVVPYKPIHPQVRLRYGGRRGMERVVKVYENVVM